MYVRVLLVGYLKMGKGALHLHCVRFFFVYMRHIAKVTALLEYTTHFSTHTHEATISALSYIIFFRWMKKKVFSPIFPAAQEDEAFSSSAL